MSVALPRLRQDQENTLTENLYTKAWFDRHQLNRNLEAYRQAPADERAVFHAWGLTEIAHQALQSVRRVAFACFNTAKQFASASQRSLIACRRRNPTRLPAQENFPTSNDWRLCAISALHALKATLETPVAMASGVVQLMDPPSAFKIRRLLRSGDLRLLGYCIDHASGSIRVNWQMREMNRSQSNRVIVSTLELDQPSLPLAGNRMDQPGDLGTWRGLSRLGTTDQLPALHVEKAAGATRATVENALTPSQILDRLVEDLVRQTAATQKHAE